MVPEVKFSAHTANAMVPRRHSAGAAGYDLYSISDGVIEPLSCAVIKTGFSLDIPAGLFGVILGRSGLAANHGIEVKTSYCTNGEELSMCLYNTSLVPFKYEKGMRIAQLTFMKIFNPQLGTNKSQ